MAELKARKCKACHEPYTPSRPLQRACSPICAMNLARQAREKAERRETRARRERIKSRAQWVKDAQQSFNRWIRLRDAGKPCISCGRHHEGQIHAGHYLSTGARPELRFDPMNVHAQCQPCNVHLSGNLVMYRQGLIQRIGLAEVERLEGPCEPKKWTSDDLKALRDEYRRKARELE